MYFVISFISDVVRSFFLLLGFSVVVFAVVISLYRYFCLSVALSLLCVYFVRSLFMSLFRSLCRYFVM